MQQSRPIEGYDTYIQNRTLKIMRGEKKKSYEDTNNFKYVLNVSVEKLLNPSSKQSLDC